MRFNQIYRERALKERARQEPLDDRLQITAPHEWLIVAGLGVMLLALMAYGLWGTVERTKTYEAVLVLPGERHDLVAPASGTVTEVLVEAADNVGPGQAIAYVRTSTAQRRESVIVGIIDALEESGQSLEGSQRELLRALRAAGSAAESASRAEVVSPHGGSVAALDLVPGQTVTAGESVGLVLTSADGQPEAVAFISPDDAERISAGTAARVGVGRLGGGTGQGLPGEVTEVSVRPVIPPKWMSSQGLVVPQQSHQLRAALLGDRADLPLIDGSRVSLHIVLGYESMISLLSRGSGR